jgi:hypothetical protein
VRQSDEHRLMVGEKAWFALQAEVEKLRSDLSAVIRCPRCGRPDLPLRLMPEHVGSCMSRTDAEDDAFNEIVALKADLAAGIARETSTADDLEAEADRAEQASCRNVAAAMRRAARRLRDAAEAP